MEEEKGFLQLYHEPGNSHTFDADMISWMPFNAPFIFGDVLLFSMCEFSPEINPCLVGIFARFVYLFSSVSAWGIYICLFKCV